jgi:MFS family permease
LIVINLLGIGLLDAFESKPLILISSVVLQILGGIGNGINVPSTMAMLSSFKKKRDIYIGYFELVNGLSALIGPLAGSCFYWFMGFPGPYLTLGGAYGIALLYFWQRKQALEDRMADMIAHDQEKESMRTPTTT